MTWQNDSRRCSRRSFQSASATVGSANADGIDIFPRHLFKNQHPSSRTLDGNGQPLRQAVIQSDLIAWALYWGADDRLQASPKLLIVSDQRLDRVTQYGCNSLAVKSATEATNCSAGQLRRQGSNSITAASNCHDKVSKWNSRAEELRAKRAADRKDTATACHKMHALFLLGRNVGKLTTLQWSYRKYSMKEFVQIGLQGVLSRPLVDRPSLTRYVNILLQILLFKYSNWM